MYGGSTSGHIRESSFFCVNTLSDWVSNLHSAPYNNSPLIISALPAFRHIFHSDIQSLIRCCKSHYMLTWCSRQPVKCSALANEEYWLIRVLLPLVTVATSEKPPAHSVTSPWRAELCFSEIGHLHRATTSKAALKQGSKQPCPSPSHTHTNFDEQDSFSHLPLIQIEFTLSPSTEILNEQQKWKYFIFNGEQREREFQLFSLTNGE